jgi:hypothetical protein
MFGYLLQLEEIRKDVEIISQSHERDVDRKDAVLQMLDRDVDEAEEQYQVALRQHLRNIDSFIDVHVRTRLAVSMVWCRMHRMPVSMKGSLLYREVPLPQTREVGTMSSARPDSPPSHWLHLVVQDAKLLAIERQFEEDLETLNAEFKEERREIEEKVRRVFGWAWAAWVREGGTGGGGRARVGCGPTVVVAPSPCVQHAANRDELLSVIVTINDEEAEKFADLKQQYDTEMEECRSKNVEAVNALAASLDNVIEVSAW